MKIYYKSRKVYFSKSKFKKSDVINLLDKCKDFKEIKDKFFIVEYNKTRYFFTQSEKHIRLLLSFDNTYEIENFSHYNHQYGIGIISEYHNSYSAKRVNKCKADGDFEIFDFIDEGEIKYYEF
jgi:hypothetical protein